MCIIRGFQSRHACVPLGESTQLKRGPPSTAASAGRTACLRRIPEDGRTGRRAAAASRFYAMAASGTQPEGAGQGARAPVNSRLQKPPVMSLGCLVAGQPVCAVKHRRISLTTTVQPSNPLVCMAKSTQKNKEIDGPQTTRPIPIVLGPGSQITN